jgi:adenylate kinase
MQYAGRRKSVALTLSSISSFLTILPGLEAAELMKAGALVPDAMILRLILRELQARAFIPTGSSLSDALQAGKPLPASESPSASFILDGFPRTAQQAQRLDTLMPPNFVVHLQTPTDILLSRIASRWVHEPSGRVYNIGFNTPRVPGRDDVTGEPLIQREDDSEEVWRERLRKFDADSGSLLDWYAREGVLWRVKGNTSDEISPKLFTEFESRFA